MTFLAAGRLWWLLLVAAFIVAYVLMQFRRKAYAVRFTNVELLDSVAPRRPSWRRHVPAALMTLAAIGLVGALAAPARSTEVPRERATIVLAIDTSLSMEADDVRPSRIEAAKTAAVEFIRELPEEINLGIVSFNGVAVVRVAPTTDRQSAIVAVEALELDEATAIGEAIFASLQALDSVPPDETGSAPPARIVVMSDGETTAGRADEIAVEAALQAAIPVSTIAFGTDAGAISLPDQPFVPVPVNEAALLSIAQGTGGQFFAAASAAELADVYRDIGSSVGFVEVESDVTEWFVGGSLLVLALAAATSLAWFSRFP
ncbi:MAG: VWA domain-containing protein [Acidimicrobiales bacterium]